MTGALFLHSALVAASPELVSVRTDLALQILMLAVFWWWCTLRSGSLLSAPFVFVLAIFFWHSSFLAGRYFDLNEIFQFPGSVLTYGEDSVPLAVALVSMSMAAAVAGAAIAFFLLHTGRRAIRRSGSAEYNLLIREHRSTHAERYAWLLFIGYVLLSCLYELIEGRAALSGSYLDAYAAATGGSVLYRLYQMTKFLGVPIMLLVIVVSKSTFRFYAAAAGVLLLAFTSALTGARTMPFLYVLTLVIAVDYFRRRVSLKVIVALAFAGAAVSWIMSEARVTGVGLHVFSLSPAEEGISFWHLLWNSGGSIRAVLRTIAFSSHTAPYGGATFMQALVYVIPSPVVSMLFPGWNPQPPSVWMLEQSMDVARGEPVGMGYSLVAEAFLNFRGPGMVLFLMVGWLIAHEYFRFRLHKDRFSGVQAASLAVLFALHLRNDSMTYARVMVWGAALIWFGGWIARRQMASRAGESPRRLARTPASTSLPTSSASSASAGT